MNALLHNTLAAALLLAGAGTAHAQKVYRCGPDGRIYQQAPCADGKAIDAGDPRTAEQRQAAKEVARGDAKVAAKFDHDNLPASAAKAGKPPQATSSTTVKGPASAPKAASAPDKPVQYLVPTTPKPAP
jgi:hypothetical protein